MAIVLNDGYLVEGNASVASKVDYTISGLDGTTLVSLASGQLSDSKATLVTASGVDTIAGITLFNTHTSAVSVDIYVNDGTSRQVVGIDSFGARYHALFDGSKLYVYDANGNLKIVTTYGAHKDEHDPEDGSDPLDTAVASEIAGVQAAGIGSAHSYARSDHAHQIQHGISDNHLVTIDDADAADNDYAKFTTNGLEGRSYAEVLSDIGALAVANLENPPTEDESSKAPTSEWAYDHKESKTAHHSNLVTLTFIIDGGGSAITTGEKGHLEMPFACTITGVTMCADQSGSIVVDVWKDSYANFPPDNADSITASAPPTISTAQKSQDTTLTDWTTAISAGDILAFNVDSCSTITRVTISIRATKT